MFYPKFLGLALVCILFSGALCLLPVFADNGATEAMNAIREAEAEILNCYEATAEADRVGADVSDLLKLLDEAGMLLSKAYLAFENGDYALAVDFATQSKTWLSGVVIGANGLKDHASQAARWDFIVNVVGSSLGAVAVVFGGLAVWVSLKKHKNITERV